jgi:two-component system alkaline phosphatase synthesis response regulator PhoP
MARILVVDDEPDIVRAVVRLLNARGHDVATARDGHEALEHVRRSPPDLVIVDLDLPRIDGLEVCRRIKSSEATRHIPVVMMTAAYLSVADANRGTRLGADEFLAKPFTKQVLLHNVARLLP